MYGVMYGRVRSRSRNRPVTSINAVSGDVRAGRAAGSSGIRAGRPRPGPTASPVHSFRRPHRKNRARPYTARTPVLDKHAGPTPFPYIPYIPTRYCIHVGGTHDEYTHIHTHTSQSPLEIYIYMYVK